MSASMSDADFPLNPEADWRRLLTPSERVQMLSDIARVSLAVGARLFPDRPWSDLDISEGARNASQSPIERLGFIEHILPLLTQAAQQIGRHPLTQALSSTHRITPPIRARRVKTAALLDAVRQGPHLRSLDESRTVLSHDTPENRAVKAFLLQLHEDSRAIRQIAEACGETQAEERAVRCVHCLGGLLALPCWEEVAWEKAAWTKPPTARASLRPEYAGVFHAMARCRRDFQFDWNNPRLTLPARETWQLYETWCLFTVLHTVSRLGYVPTGSDVFAVKEGRLTWTLAADTASRLTFFSPGGKRLTLTYRPTFSEGRHSLSHTMQPDIVLADEERLWILDAKFKPYALPGDEGSDINQMHAYRDAIIDDSGRRAVAFAWCLYAGQTGFPNRPRLTYGRTEDATVGALCLRPGEESTFTNLTALLSGWLKKAPPSAVPPPSRET